MNRRKPVHREKWWVYLVRIPLLTLEFLLKPFTIILDTLVTKPLARMYERRLAADLQRQLRFLFKDYQAHIIPNVGVPLSPPLDYAFVTVRLENLFLRFLRGRGELSAVVAPAFDPSDWHDVSLVVGLLREDVPHLERKFYRDLGQLASNLKPYMKELLENTTPERFSEIKRRLQTEFYAPEEAGNRQWSIETNARLYGPE